MGRAHAEFLGDVKPATTMVEVSRLIDERLLVEIEADAKLGWRQIAGAAAENRDSKGAQGRASSRDSENPRIDDASLLRPHPEGS